MTSGVFAWQRREPGEGRLALAVLCAACVPAAVAFGVVSALIAHRVGLPVPGLSVGSVGSVFLAVGLVGVVVHRRSSAR